MEYQYILLSADSETKNTASSFHRSILVVLLIIAALIGFSWDDHGRNSVNVLFTAFGMVVAVSTSYWIFDLVVEGTLQ